MTQANLALRFLLELISIAAVAYWGYNATVGPVRWVLAIAAPSILVVIWAFLIAPGADVPIPPQVRVLLGTALLLAAAALLFLAGQRAGAAILAAAIVVNAILMFVLPD